MSETHELKTWPEMFEDILISDKNFDYRKNDRNFQIGDVLRLREYDPKSEEYTGRSLDVLVHYIVENAPPEFGIPKGYCIMGIRPARKVWLNEINLEAQLAAARTKVAEMVEKWEVRATEYEELDPPFVGGVKFCMDDLRELQKLLGEETNQRGSGGRVDAAGGRGPGAGA